ncbi:MAG TPA: hypothetical protein VKS98_04755 [Chthoniobacterales bacterium]|nr:hypothetical protein [Chthoniobacterales bacterium]
MPLLWSSDDVGAGGLQTCRAYGAQNGSVVTEDPTALRTAV